MTKKWLSLFGVLPVQWMGENDWSWRWSSEQGVTSQILAEPTTSIKTSRAGIGEVFFCILKNKGAWTIPAETVTNSKRDCPHGTKLALHMTYVCYFFLKVAQITKKIVSWLVRSRDSETVNDLSQTNTVHCSVKKTQKVQIWGYSMIQSLVLNVDQSMID